MRIFNFISIMILLMACKPAKDRSCFKLSGSTKQITKALGAVSIIEVNDNIELTIIQSTRQEIEIETAENLINFIKAENNDGTLILENNNRCNFLRDEKKKVEIRLYINNFSKLINGGYGNILIPSTFSTSKLRIENKGFGDMDLNVDLSDSLILVLSSSNNTRVSGNANSLYAYIVGNIQMHTLGLDSVGNANIIAFTNVDVYIKADSTLFVNQVANGTIYYKGNPKVINKTGTAKIEKLD